MRIWHISDTHGYHNLLSIPKDVDTVIHSGDASNYRDIIRNEIEMYNFIQWYSGIDIPNKILKMVLFGHIHDCGDTVSNGGILIRDGITYSNGSVVKDGHFGKLYHNGNTFNIF